jgi:hypothetical protein
MIFLTGTVCILQVEVVVERERERCVFIFLYTYLWYFMVCYLYRVHPVGCLCASVEREISTFLPTKFLPTPGTCYIHVCMLPS